MNKIKKIYINENQYVRLCEAKTTPPLSWFLGNISNGKYDITIYEKMRKRDPKQKLAKYVNYFPVNEDDKETLYDAMIERYETILTCMANTKQIGKAIMEGMFDEDIINDDYSWLNNVFETEIVDSHFIRYYIEYRIKQGKKFGLFKGLQSSLECSLGYKFESWGMLSSLMNPKDLLEIKR